MKKLVEITVCDICESADLGSYSNVKYVDDYVYSEEYCPIDLCKEHMSVYKENFTDISRERYDPEFTEIEKQRLVEKIKDKILYEG